MPSPQEPRFLCWQNMACVVIFLEQLAYSGGPMLQQVCTTICSLQSSLDRRLFVAGTQPLGTVVMKVVEPLTGSHRVSRTRHQVAPVAFHTILITHLVTLYILYTIKFVFCYTFHNILSQLILAYFVPTGLSCHRSSEILTAPEENTDILEGPSYCNWKVNCGV